MAHSEEDTVVYIVKELECNSIKKVVFSGLSAIYPDEFDVLFHVKIYENGDIEFTLALIDESDSISTWVDVPFTELLLNKHLPAFAIDSECFLTNIFKLSIEEIWSQALETAIIETEKPKVEFSRKGKTLIVEFSFGRFYAKSKIPFAKVSHLLK